MKTSFRNVAVTFATALVIMTIFMFPLGHSIYAISPYSSGYSHGCSDAKLGGHFYLDTPGKGPSFHTSTFMQGYNDGYSSCLGATNTSAYQQGYEQGYKKAVNSYAGSLSTNFNDSCPYGHSSEFCNGYVHGYDAGWQFENSDQ
jgi:hypothetical protein